MSKYEQLLKNTNLKVTPQRLNILETIQNIGHATIEEIYEHIQQKHPSISLATIYKNVCTLCGVGVLQEIKTPSNKARYEILHNNHPHLVCTQCGMITDLDCNPRDLIFNQNLPQHFQYSDLSIIFYGLCQHCASC
ncbi:hypothetical protein BBW65_04590 [Helicobacter enhydrae]|uniref:Uncharacterized protein n=1 Tax=Helicobacter enhydrae TaxID=222136 RepID=A0A1B1U5W9_9HELI|nr:Fur family transcriptional regulator [Helicobacter enhydrae]ANV98121.1 hypothetical protein BBW65_04590 [Helicobacter enhydrae]